MEHGAGNGQSQAGDQTPQRVPLLAGRPGTVRGLGYDERWLQDWLAADPTRLGLGDVSIIDQEQNQTSGGLLDLLAHDSGSDTYYSIEVQLGEIDGSHSFRVFDYWARNRARIPGKTHVAVLMAENASGRFRPALEALAETVPLIVIELRCWQGTGEALLIPEVVIANDSLDLSETPAAATTEERTETDWRHDASDEAWAFGRLRDLGDRESRSGPGRLQAEVVHRCARRAPNVGAALAAPGRRDALPARPRRIAQRGTVRRIRAVRVAPPR